MLLMDLIPAWHLLIIVGDASLKAHRDSRCVPELIDYACYSTIITTLTTTYDYTYDCNSTAATTQFITCVLT